MDTPHPDLQAQPLGARRSYPARARFPGRLIAVEGIDGSGKSTQVRLLFDWLQMSGYCVHLTTWNSSPMLRRALRRAKRAHTLTPMTYCLLHAADLADRLERDVMPRLRAGHVVLADRWACTAFARDGARGLDPRWLRRLFAFAPRPNLAVYFRVPVEVAARRIGQGRDGFSFYEAGLDLSPGDPATGFRIFQQRVADGYEALVRRDRLHVFDGRDPVTAQQLRLREMVAEMLPPPPPVGDPRTWTRSLADRAVGAP